MSTAACLGAADNSRSFINMLMLDWGNIV